MQKFKTLLIRSNSHWNCCGGIFDPATSQKRLDELVVASEKPDLWDKPEAAQVVMREKNNLERQLKSFHGLEQELDDHVTLLELGEMENDDKTVREAEAAIFEMEKNMAKKQLETLLSGEADANDCYLEVHAGAGGTEAQDWAMALQRMYMRYAERHGYKVEILEQSDGEEAGIKSATMQISGHNAYGWLKTESGVHRLVRISPFDSNARRHTSFSSVWVFPVVDDNINIEILDKDLRVDTYRASGAGGQHVNKTDSAIRITHLPTNIVVQCQTDRSQHRNRAAAMSMLKSRLYEKELQEREAQATANQGNKTDIGWGHQIRSYVLHPYQMVKDLRTNIETSNTGGVLDGDLDMFIEAALAAKVGK